MSMTGIMWLLGLFGIGGVALWIAGGVAFVGLLGFVRSAIDFLRSPLGLVLIAVVIWFGGNATGYQRGASVERQRCAELAAESQRAAAAIDARIRTEIAGMRAKQDAAIAASEAKFQRGIEAYEREIAGLPDVCRLGDAAIERLRQHGIEFEDVPSREADPAAGRRGLPAGHPPPRPAPRLSR